MKNWKTTLGGILLGITMLVGPRLAGQPGAPPITTGNLLPAIAAIVAGVMQKDHDSTGGTR